MTCAFTEDQLMHILAIYRAAFKTESLHPDHINIAQEIVGSLYKNLDIDPSILDQIEDGTFG
jgi:hypothetical protein